MAVSMRKIKALLRKEVKTLPKNKNVLFMSLIPILLSVFCNYLLGNSNRGNPMVATEMLFVCVGMNVTLISSYIVAMLIAEEKEKNTLRTLMLSGVTPMEFFVGKMLITVLMSEITDLAIFFIIGINIRYLGTFLLLTTLVVLSMIGIGGAIGIIAPNQMATGMIGMPVLMVLVFVPMLALINDTMAKISKFLPNYSMKLLLDQTMLGAKSGVQALFQIMVIILWIILSAVVFTVTYHKIGLDK